MTAEQSAAELTTRDVLLQVDRRLTLIEEDLRSLDGKVDDLDDKLDTKIAALDAKIDTRIEELDTKIARWTPSPCPPSRTSMQSSRISSWSSRTSAPWNSASPCAWEA